MVCSQRIFMPLTKIFSRYGTRWSTSFIIGELEEKEKLIPYNKVLFLKPFKI